MADATDTPLIRIFVSSPADVMAERERVSRVVARLNAALAGAVRLEAVRWEANYYTAESTFQHQIVDPGVCDVVVSIFWQRLGSELPPDFERMRDGRPYPSGTVFELTKALQAAALSSHGLPQVFVYRKMADVAVPMSDRDRYRQAHEQREAFLAFWEEWFVSEQGHFKAAYNTFQSSDEFESTFEAHLRAWLKTRGYVGVGSHWSLSEKGSPFRGLEPFDAAHEAVFFGRAREIERALDRLGREDGEEKRRRFLLIVGESGSGKSSLARAGVLPRIGRGALGGEPQAWRACAFRPGAAADPLLALAEALLDPGALPEVADGDFKSAPALRNAMAVSPELGVTPVLNALDRVARVVQQRIGSDLAPQGGLVVLVDQGEELFAPGLDPTERDRLVIVLDALAATDRVVVVATLRADSYPEFTRDPALCALKNAGQSLDVSTPGAAEVAEIVRAPAAAAGLSFGVTNAATGERLDDVIIHAATGRDALPLLQFTLSRLYDAMLTRLERSGRTLGNAEAADLTLTQEDYLAFGGLEGAIGERAEEAFAALDPQAQARLPRLLRGLAALESGGADAAERGTLRLYDLPSARYEQDPHARALADALSAARIVVGSGGSGGDRGIRLAHEAVLRTWPRARDIVAEHQQFFRIKADVEAAMGRYARHRAEHGARGAAAFLLPGGLPLAEAESIRARFADELAPDLVAFIEQSGSKTRKRQRLLAVATVIFALTAVGAGIGAMMANRSEMRASRNFNLAIEQADALVSKISGELKDLSISRDALRRILVAIEAQYNAIAAIDPDHPRLLLSRARMLTVFVDNYLDLVETTEALRRAEECVSITRKLVVRVPDDRDMAAGLGACLERLGTARRDRGLLNEAIAAYQESVVVRRNLVAAEAGNPAWQRDLSDALRYLGVAFVRAERTNDAVPPLEEALAIARRVADGAPDDPGALRLFADGLNTYAIVLSRLDRFEDSLAQFRASMAVARRLVALQPDNATWRRYLSNILANSSAQLRTLKRFDEALAALDESMTLRRGLVALDPGNMTWQRELSYILVEIGSVLVNLKRNEDALRSYREAVAIVRKLIEIDSGNVAWKNELRSKLPPVAQLLVELGQREEAIALLRECIALFQHAAALTPDDPLQFYELAYVTNYLGNLLYGLNRTEEALASYRSAITNMRRYLAAAEDSLPARRDFATMLANAGRALALSGHRAAAAASFEESLQVWQRIVEADGSTPHVLQLAGVLRDAAVIAPDPRALLRALLAALRLLEGRGELPDTHKGWIPEAERRLAGLDGMPAERKESR